LTYDSHGKEAEFDRMLMSDAHTKRIQVNKGKEEATIWHKSIDPPLAPLPLKSLSTATSPVQAARAAAAAPAPVASPTQAHAQPTFKVVSRDRAMSVGQTEPARQGQVHQAVQGGAERRDRSNQASEEEDEIRTPDMSRDDGFGTPVVVGTNAGHASMLSKLSPIAPHTKQNPVPLPGYGGLNAHTALQQMSLSPSSVSDDPYSLTKPAKAKPLPVAPHASPPRRIQPPALTEYEIRAQAESGSDRAEVLAPSPRPPSRDSADMLEAGIEANNVLAEHGGGERDTIHGIVEGYSEAESMRDGRYRGVDDVDEVGVEHEEEGYDYDDEEALGSASTGYQHPHLRIISDEERERIKFRPVSDVEGEDGEFRPPGPLFDVAPTREPSPGRYQHGLPLHHGTSIHCSAAGVRRGADEQSRRRKKSMPGIDERAEGINTAGYRGCRIGPCRGSMHAGSKSLAMTSKAPLTGDKLKAKLDDWSGEIRDYNTVRGAGKKDLLPSSPVG
jgi:hypothetical protein